MKTLKHCLIILICVSSMTSFAQTQVFNPNEGKIKVSAINSELVIKSKDEASIHKTTKQSVAALTAILPALIETGITVVKSELKKREESYAAEYKVKTSGSGFWKNKNRLNLPLLEYKKYILPKTENAVKKDAVSFILEPFQSEDGMAFRYKLKNLNLNYTEARTNEKYPTINLEIEIKFSAFVITDGKYAKTDLGENSIIVSGVVFGDNSNIGEYYTGWFPILQSLESPNPNGNYEIELTIKEANPGSLSTKKIAKFFEDNGEKIQETSKIIIENIFPKEEKEEENATANNNGDGGNQTNAAEPGGN